MVVPLFLNQIREVHVVRVRTIWSGEAALDIRYPSISLAFLHVVEISN